MYEIERKNHNELRLFYEKKLESWQNDNKLLVNKYEQRLTSLVSEIHQIRASSTSQFGQSKKSINSKKEHTEQPSIDSDHYESIHRELKSNNP